MEFEREQDMKQILKRGTFILFEGIDRCGKTTQSKRLVDYLNSKGHKAVHYRFPDRSTEMGKMIDAYLSKKADLDDRAIHLLFSANRWERSAFLRNTLASGSHIVVDRYSPSGVAFSHAKGLPLDWCYAPERGLPAPDVVLYLELPVEVAQKRGDFGAERYERVDFQRHVALAFDKLKSDGWKTLDATLSPDDLHSKVLKEALESIQHVSSANLPLGELR